MPQLGHLNTPFDLQAMVEQLQQTVSDFGGYITHNAATKKVVQLLGFTSLEDFYLANPALIPQSTPLANWQAILQQAEGHVTAITINGNTLTPNIDWKALQLFVAALGTNHLTPGLMEYIAIQFPAHPELTICICDLMGATEYPERTYHLTNGTTLTLHF